MIAPRVAKMQFQPLRCGTGGIDAVIAHTARTLSRHTHDQFGVGAMRTGAHRSCSGRGQVEAVAGDTITVNPGEVHDGAPVGGRRSWGMLYFETYVVQSAAEDVFGHFNTAFEYTQPVIGDPRTSKAFWRLLRAEINPATPPILREELLLSLISRAGSHDAKISNETPGSIRLARQRIDDDPGSPITLLELATLCGVSRFHLIRSFARAIGLTPHAYLLQQRTALARRLIATGLPLAEAAAAAGFADQSHMTRAFARYYGFSPGAYAAANATRTDRGEQFRSRCDSAATT